MNSAERIVASITFVLLATTLVLPGRQTPEIIDKFFTGTSKLSKSVIGQG
jgi:hypothetical protein